MSSWDLNTGFSGLSLSTEFDDYDLYWNGEDDDEQEVVAGLENFGEYVEDHDNEEGEELFVGWDYSGEEIIGWEWDLYGNFQEEEEEGEEEIVGWESFYDDPDFLDDFEEEVLINVVAVGQDRWIKHYCSSHKILLVGEGDFSFSTSLAMAFGSASNIVATSLDSQDFLGQNYSRAISNIIYLGGKGCRVMHGVDATKMAKHPLLQGRKFDRVVFNFPFAGFFKTESRESQLSKHKRLVRRFLKNAKKMIKERGGEVHITHKTNGFHREWNLEGLASIYGLRLIEAVEFECSDYPGYANKCGFGGDNGFDCNPSKTFKFGHVP